MRVDRCAGIWDTCMGHVYGTRVWDTCMGHVYGTCVWDMCMGHVYGACVWDICMGHVYIHGVVVLDDVGSLKAPTAQYLLAQIIKSLIELHAAGYPFTHHSNLTKAITI